MKVSEIGFNHKFMGCDAKYNESKIVIFGAGYDGTTSNRPGTRFAPDKIRAESYGLETYSPKLDLDLADYKICDKGNLKLPFGAPKPALKEVYNCAFCIANDDKVPFMIGGEHSLTCFAYQAMFETSRTFETAYIIQFDAHADLRDEYLGESLSHACVMRRVCGFAEELCKTKEKIFQFGIRSGEKEEFEYAKKNTNLTKFNFDGLEKICNELRANGERVYITIDLDILDPSVFPATGTPEPGGVTFQEFERAIQNFRGLNVCGMDVMEYSPPYDSTGSSAAVAAKAVRELLLILAETQAKFEE